MSKIKDHLERIREKEYDEYVSFMEWVCDQETEVSVTVTNEEEEDREMPSTKGTLIVPANTLNAANNINYSPKKGA